MNPTTPTASEIVAALRSRRGAPAEADPHAYAEPVTRAGAGRAPKARGARAGITDAGVAALLGVEVRP